MSHAETLVDIRSIIARIHDSRAGVRDPGLSAIEMAALRDCCLRLTETIGELNTSTTKRRTEWKSPVAGPALAGAAAIGLPSLCDGTGSHCLGCDKCQPPGVEIEPPAVLDREDAP